MTEHDYRKQLLVAKIDAHRQIFQLEVRSARVGLDPVRIGLGWLGVDRALVDTLVPAARSLFHSRELSDLKRPEILLAVAAALLAALGIGQQVSSESPSTESATD